MITFFEARMRTVSRMLAAACALWLLQRGPEEGRPIDLTVRLDMGTEPGRFFEVTGDVLVSYSVMASAVSGY